MRQLLIGMAMTISAMVATPVRAAIFTYIVTGNVIGDASDGGAAFGEDVVGRGFTARFEVDDAMPLALYVADTGGSSARGGGSIQDGTRPPVAAMLTINGVERAVRTGDEDMPPMCIPGFGCFGASSGIDDSGEIVKNAVARTLSLSAGYDSYAGCCADYGSWYSIATDDLRFSLFDASFTSPDYRQDGAFAVSGTGAFATVFSDGDRSGGVDYSTRLTLAPTLLQVTGGAVPEPGTWAMMLLGFALIGGGLRHGRAAAPAARAARQRGQAA